MGSEMCIRDSFSSLSLPLYILICWRSLTLFQFPRLPFMSFSFSLVVVTTLRHATSFFRLSLPFRLSCCDPIYSLPLLVCLACFRMFLGVFLATVSAAIGASCFPLQMVRSIVHVDRLVKTPAITLHEIISQPLRRQQCTSLASGSWLT